MKAVIASARKKPASAITPAKVIAKRLESIRFRSELFQLILRIGFIALVGWYLLTHVFLITQVKGQDMFPALKDGDLVIAFRMQKEYVKGDVVVCMVDGQQYVGRIAANASDVVNFSETGSLIVNGTVQGGEIVYPTYAREPLEYPFRVPEDAVFLLGDHRTESYDSRDFGPVPYTQVQGKVITILRRREL